MSLLNFRITLVTAQNAVLDREAALRNLLGLPPMDGQRLVPISPPTTQREPFAWPTLLELAEDRRPDLVELKLILEADQQLLLQVRNAAYPQLDAVGRYRWNGLEGELPDGTYLRSQPGQFTDWTLGVNFSVPLGLRRGRASLRSQELVIARDRANLQQGLHAVTHDLALNLRGIERAWTQYDLAKQTRDAARLNLNLQIENYLAGRSQFINTLLAINDWGNAISRKPSTCRCTTPNWPIWNVKMGRFWKRTVSTSTKSDSARWGRWANWAGAASSPLRCLPARTPHDIPRASGPPRNPSTWRIPSNA